MIYGAKNLSFREYFVTVYNKLAYEIMKNVEKNCSHTNIFLGTMTFHIHIIG